MYQTVHEEPVPPSRVADTCPARYDAVVAKALAKDRRARFASAAEFRHALQQVAEAGAVVFEPTLTDLSPDHRRGFEATMPAPLATATVPPSTGGSLLGASTIGVWDAAALAPVEAALARVLGPLAKLLVRQAARHCRDMASLTGRVAEHVADPRERAAFLARVAGMPAGAPRERLLEQLRRRRSDEDRPR